MGCGRGLVRKLVRCQRRRLSNPSESELVAEGCIRVVVGKVDGEQVVVEMEANYLNHPLLEKLLSLTGEEYGYSYTGALRIACDIHLFRYLLQLLNTRNPSAHCMDLPDLISNFSKATYGCHWSYTQKVVHIKKKRGRNRKRDILLNILRIFTSIQYMSLTIETRIICTECYSKIYLLGLTNINTIATSHSVLHQAIHDFLQILSHVLNLRTWYLSLLHC